MDHLGREFRAFGRLPLDLHTAALRHLLGLSSATNFSKYFHLRTGHAPLAFRSVIRGQTPPEE